MAIHRATCEDCAEEYTDPDLLKVSDWAEDHERKEMHSVEITKAVATDGGRDHVIVSRFKTRGVYHDPDPDNPDEPACQCTEYATREWQRRSLATLSDRYSYCKYCNPDEHVALKDHPETQLAAKLRNGVNDIEDGELVPDGGQQTISVPVYAHVAGDGGVHCSYGARIATVDTLTPPEDTTFATVEWIEGQFHQQDWADEVIEGIVSEPHRESLDVDKCRVGTLTADPAASAIVDLTFEEPDEIPGPNLSTDGGHGPAAASAGAQVPRDDSFATDEAPHKCDLCGQVFDDVDELEDHDCRPPGDLLVGDGGGPDA